jgi:hypothetical protein
MADDLTPPPGVEAMMRALDRQKKIDAEWNERQEQHRRKSEIARVDRAAFLEHCRPATLLDYTAWMIGYVQRGCEPSHVYDYPFARTAMQVVGDGDPTQGPLEMREAGTDWWVLSEVPEHPMPSLYGANSLHLIVPAGLGYEPDSIPGTGHSTVYFMQGFALVGHWTPVYTDMLPVLAAGL